MKPKRFRPAVVVTFATLLAACERRPPGPDAQPKPPPTNPPMPTDMPETPPSIAADASNAADGSGLGVASGDASTQAATFKRRKVRNPLPTRDYVKGPIDWKDVKGVNPFDAKGRTIYASSDGSCYVKVPPPPGTPIGPPGIDRSTPETVDCPDAMQDPAWDTCFGETMSRLANGKCICAHTGNPPPPPSNADCPK